NSRAPNVKTVHGTSLHAVCAQRIGAAQTRRICFANSRAPNVKTFRGTLKNIRSHGDFAAQ
ncbi:MAG: hypothetical protein IJ268_10745, partial [Proteobacteria bacterium]|nr:hypothetical protein [Pseudomonadota bacterium]